jgi:hypothetical protein
MQRPQTFAILVISTLLLCAQGQETNVAKLKADARKVVGTIGGDRAKTQIYCQTLDLGKQLDQANRERNSKKAIDLSSKIDLLQKKLGPDLVTLVHTLEGIDPESPDGQELASIIESLDESCD